MPRYLIVHEHAPHAVPGSAFTSFKGHPSVLRHRTTLASCVSGGHAIWWVVDAATDAEALALLPFFVAERSAAIRVGEVEIP